MTLILIILLILLILGSMFLQQELAKRQHFGALTQPRVYLDTEQQPGQVLYAKSVSLVGKPDYLIQESGGLVPVEVKTGKTPTHPYRNHQFQLMAYCLLVEENFGKQPGYGYLNYPDKQFKIFYTPQKKAELIQIIAEITASKQSNRELHCTHKEHYLKA